MALSCFHNLGFMLHQLFLFPHNYNQAANVNPTSTAFTFDPSFISYSLVFGSKVDNGTNCPHHTERVILNRRNSVMILNSDV